jgi:FkbM family methyltransferase
MKHSAAALFRMLWRSIPSSARGRLLPSVLSGISDSAQFRHGIPNLRGLLEHLRENGFSPETIIDVGAFTGTWSQTAHEVFPDARFFLVDGNPENRERLATATRRFKQSDSQIALLGPEDRSEVMFYVHTSGSSVLRELTSFDRDVKRLPMRRLDDVAAGFHCAGPCLLKLDVQGFELEVLRGARTTLENSEAIILEVSLLPYNEGAPLFGEVVAFMAEAGFVVYDFCGQHRRQSDHTLFQTDVVFVRANSPLRACKKFWLTEP